MAQVLVTESYLDDIADAIRDKTGSEDTYTPAQMAGAIEDIHTSDEVVLVSKSISANGTYNPASDSADGYSGVTVNVPNTYTTSDEGKVVSSGNLVSQSSKSITQNGTHDTTMNNSVSVDVPNSYSASDNGKVVVNQALTAQTSKNINANGTHDTTANNSVVVDVPNSYEAADEGKVVSGGALVNQTPRNVTVNGTYDTTSNNEVVVNVPTGGGSGTLIPKTVTQNGTYNASDDNADGYNSVTVNVSGGSDEIVIPDLPTGYTKIESVYFSGNNGYIKIPSVPAHSKIKVKFQPKDDGEYPIIASKKWGSSTNYDFEFLYRTSSGIIPYLWCRNKNASMITYDDIDVSIRFEQINPQPSVTNSKYLLIFYAKIAIGVDYPSDSGQYIYIGWYNTDIDYKGNAYYCIVTNQTETENLYFFVPCYRNNDDAVGFYDVVNDVFYENEGNGTFQIGTYL